MVISARNATASKKNYDGGVKEEIVIHVAMLKSLAQQADDGLSPSQPSSDWVTLAASKSYTTYPSIDLTSTLSIPSVNSCNVFVLSVQLRCSVFIKNFVELNFSSSIFNIFQRQGSQMSRNVGKFNQL